MLVAANDGVDIGLVEVATYLVLAEGSADAGAGLGVVGDLGYKDIETSPRYCMYWGIG